MSGEFLLAAWVLLACAFNVASIIWEGRAHAALKETARIYLEYMKAHAILKEFKEDILEAAQRRDNASLR